MQFLRRIFCRPSRFGTAFIEEIAAVMEKKGLSEVHLSRSGRSLILKRGTGQTGGPPVIVSSAAEAMPAPAAPATPAAATASAPPAEPAGNFTEIRSPMVGTCYLAPGPGEKPFIRQGDQVAEGQTLLIVEAMKVMNKITASASGKVATIQVKDAQPVEFDEVLVLIEPLP